MNEPLRIELFGGLRVLQGARVITRFRTRNSGLLLAYLAYFRDRSHPRETLIEMLWPDSEPSTGRQRLSLALSSLRRQLEPPGVPAGTVIQADRFNVRLNPQAVRTDVADYLQSLRAAKAAWIDEDRLTALDHALSAYKGELLPGYYEDWVIKEQQRLEAIHDQALRAAQALRKRVPPKRHDILAESRLAARTSTPRDRRPSVILPLVLTRFFGRENELSWLEDSLIQQRLVTLTGPGGSGKTRLAVEAAGRLAKAFPGGIWFASLADLSDHRLIPGAIVDGLCLPRSPTIEPLDQAVGYLNGLAGSVLLILDNFEHLLAEERRKSEDATALARALLERVPTLTLLVTSRQLLSLEGEREFPVLPLPIPRGQEALESLSNVPSVALFVDRGQCVRPDFQLTPHNAPAIAELCDRLEGIPLALELAAPRIQVMTPAQMVVQLDQRFDLLVSRRRDAIERHRTLHAAIEWSYRLLSPELRRLFARLSVFRGGWTVEAAEEVCEEPQALGYLAQLRECSLILAEDTDLGTRFRMLETLREFGWEELSSEERTTAQRMHVDYCLGLAEQAYPERPMPPERAWQLRLQSELDNMRAALAWTLGDMPEAALRLVGALGPFWWTRGHFVEGLAWSQVALDATPCLPSRSRARALNETGMLASGHGELDVGRSTLETGLAMHRRLGDRRGIAKSLILLGHTALLQHDFQAALQAGGEGLTIGQEIGDKGVMVDALVVLGRRAMFQGDFALARQYVENSLAISKEIADGWSVAFSLWNLGNLACARGEYNTARPMLQESLTTLAWMEDVLGVYCNMETLARVVSCTVSNPQDGQRAARILGATDAMREMMSMRLMFSAEYERSKLAVLALLGDQAFAEACAEGRAMTREQAIACALEEDR